MKASRLATWLRLGLFALGFFLLGYWTYATLDARAFQKAQKERLQELRAAAGALAGESPGAPAEPPAEGATRLPGETDPPPEKTGRAAAETGAASDPDQASTEPPLGWIDIPRVGVSAAIAAGTDAKTLRRAVGHVRGTALPGEPGNVGLAGHRDGFFRGLADIRVADLVTVTTPSRVDRYVVTGTEIVRPQDVHVLAPTDRPTLTLVTCYPFEYVGSAPERFIVTARRLGG